MLGLFLLVEVVKLFGWVGFSTRAADQDYIRYLGLS